MSSVAMVRSALPRLVMALVVLASGTGGASAAPALANCARDTSRIRIENFGCVNANYFRGAEPDDEGYARLAAFGIRTVVDLRGDDVDWEDRAHVERLGMAYVHIPMTTHDAPTPSVIEQFLRIVDAPENQPVYVHCVGGRHRTGVMTAVYRMARQGWTAERAYGEMKVYKFGPGSLHREFRAFVYRFPATRQFAPGRSES